MVQKQSSVPISNVEELLVISPLPYLPSNEGEALNNAVAAASDSVNSVATKPAVEKTLRDIANDRPSNASPQYPQFASQYMTKKPSTSHMKNKSVDPSVLTPQSTEKELQERFRKHQEKIRAQMSRPPS